MNTRGIPKGEHAHAYRALLSLSLSLQGHADAMCNLGSCHLYDTAGIERNPVQAVAWFEQARTAARSLQHGPAWRNPVPAVAWFEHDVLRAAGRSI